LPAPTEPRGARSVLREVFWLGAITRCRSLLAAHLLRFAVSQEEPNPGTEKQQEYNHAYYPQRLY